MGLRGLAERIKTELDPRLILEEIGSIVNTWKAEEGKTKYIKMQSYLLSKYYGHIYKGPVYKLNIAPENSHAVEKKDKSQQSAKQTQTVDTVDESPPKLTSPSSKQSEPKMRSDAETQKSSPSKQSPKEGGPRLK